MRITLVALSALVLAACSDTKTDPAPQTAFRFEPLGCGYTVSPPESRAFKDFALDDGKAVANGAAPERVRLGLGGSTKSGAPGYADPSTTAAFAWETSDVTVTAAQVRLGTDPNALTAVRRGYSFTVPPPERGLGTNEPPVRMHEVHVCGFEPGKTYYYQVGGDGAWSATHSFTTVPATGKIVIGVSGDSRDSADVFQLLQTRMRDAAVSMQLFSGDMVLVGTQSSLLKSMLDKAWKDPSGKLLTLGQQLIVPVAGNHENESSQFYGSFVLPGDGPYAESFASFDVGSAHVVMFDDQRIATDVRSEAANSTLAWLEEDLARANANRATRPFVIVVNHRGVLSTSNHGEDSDVLEMRELVMPLWEKHEVDLVLNGHDHDYERSKPVTGPANAPTVQPSLTAGTTYVVCAGAGAKAYAPGGGAVPYREINKAFGSGTPYVGVYGLVTLEGRSLAFKAYGLKTSGADDVLDEFSIAK